MSGRAAPAPTELAPGLWRWTARHPDWRPGAKPGSPADWPSEVGSAMVEAGGAAVFIDALVPSSAGRFWTWADGRVATSSGVLALTTTGFHRRSRELLRERYAARTSRARGTLPDGVQAVPLTGAGEVWFWLPAHRALVVGDRLLGAPGGGLRLCPPSWLRYLRQPPTAARMRELLRPLLELPVELVLVSHGEPVLAGGRAAIAEAIDCSVEL